MKKWLISAACLVAVGAIMIFAASVFHWDINDLNTEKLETNTHEITEDFSAVSIDTQTADIRFAASDDGACRVVCYEPEKLRHSVQVQNGTLSIRATDDRSWYDHIGFNLHTPSVTVYLPKAEYGALTIRESTGEVEIPGKFVFGSADISVSTGDISFSASCGGLTAIQASTGEIRLSDTALDTLSLSTSTGEIKVSDVACSGDITLGVSTGCAELTDVTCRNLRSTGSTGDITLKNTLASEKFSIERSTGEVEFNGADAADIFVKTTTGDIFGTLLSEKVFITDSSTGSVHVPKSLSGGPCELISSTGNIKIDIPE